MPPLLLVVLLFACAWLAAKTAERAPVGAAADRVLSGPVLPTAAAIIAMAAIAYVWGGLRPFAVYHDEAAYLLQAELFARFRWTLPSPVVPHAFEQAAVLVTPVLAPKMGPGHALALVPGVWLGLPALMPLLLTGATAALLVLLARRVANAAVAVLAFVVWLTAPGNLAWRPTYFSETTSGAAWLGAWWCLLEWRSTRQPRWLLGVAALTGWGAITRPLTFLAFAVPLGALVLSDVARGKHWRPLAAAIGVGTAFLLIIPLQSWRVTGSPWTTPLDVYTRQYLPSDVIGFGLREQKAERTLPADLAAAYKEFDALHAEHTVAALPAIARARVLAVLDMQTAGWRHLLAPLLLVGLVLGGAPAWFAFGSVVLVMLAYLGYAHRAEWGLYYLEALPVLSFCIALGIDRVLVWFSRRVRGGASPGVSAVTALLVLLVTLPAMWGDIAGYKQRVTSIHETQQPYFSAFRQIPDRKAIVFVQYGPEWNPHFSLVRNVANPATAQVITAYDLGPAANDSVRRAFPDRTVYVLNTSTQMLQKIVFAP